MKLKKWGMIVIDRTKSDAFKEEFMGDQSGRQRQKREEKQTLKGS